MNDSLVSIIIATYHRDVPFANALESVAKQTYKNIEIVVVSDNADEVWDGKVKSIVDEFKRSYPTTFINVIINAHNLGSAETRNVGIRAARGEYITFLDDDDLYLPQKIEQQLNAMQDENSDYGITDLYLYDEKDKLIDKRVRDYIVQTDKAALLAYHLKYHMTGTDTMMFRKMYLDRIGGFAPINIGDEFYLMERAINGGGKFCYCQGCEVKAYVHSETDGLSSGKRKIDGENELYTYKRSIWGGLDAKSRRYIRMRHYAVIAFAELRRKQYLAFAQSSLYSFFCAPLACVSLLARGR